jgi:hypothetical protein
MRSVVAPRRQGLLKGKRRPRGGSDKEQATTAFQYGVSARLVGSDAR